MCSPHSVVFLVSVYLNAASLCVWVCCCVCSVCVCGTWKPGEAPFPSVCDRLKGEDAATSFFSFSVCVCVCLCECVCVWVRNIGGSYAVVFKYLTLLSCSSGYCVVKCDSDEGEGGRHIVSWSGWDFIRKSGVTLFSPSSDTSQTCVLFSSEAALQAVFRICQ